LDHVAGFPIVAGGGKSGGDDHAIMIFVENEAVQREPPRLSMRATMAMMRRKPRAASGPWKRGGIWRFMGLAGGGLKGALDFHLKFSTYAAAFGVCDAVPNEGTG